MVILSRSVTEMNRLGARNKPKEEGMTEKRVILVTGVAGYWGKRVALRLMGEAGLAVVGLDRELPAQEIQALDFLEADVRNPLLADLLRAEEVDTVCHLAFAETIQPDDAAFDCNVMGTTKLLDACTDAGVRKVVLRSSTAVYGARPSNPAFLTEDHALRGSKDYGTVRDLIEIEKFCTGFRWQAPEVMLTILRFASIVGPTVDTPMTRFLKNPWVPSLLGFDPRMQIIHEDDVVEALAHAVLNDVPGVVNVAAREILPLNKMKGLVGKPPVSVFHPFAYWGARLRERAGAAFTPSLPIEPDYLRYSWVADLRRMEEELGFTPRYTAEETLNQLRDQCQATRGLPPIATTADEEEQLREVIKQRRRIREQQATTASGVTGGGQDE
jgi:UDP-glucose 4-epimerase